MFIKDAMRAAVLGLAIVLTACGGDADEACVEQSSIPVTSGYAGGNTLNYVLGVAKTWRFMVEGLPEACASKKTFKVVTDTILPGQPLPSGVRLDPSTGDISGVIAVELPKACEGSPIAYPPTNPDCVIASLQQSTVIEMSIPGFKPLTTRVQFKQVAVDPDKAARGVISGDEASKGRLEAD